MKTLLKPATLVCLWLLSVHPLVSQLQQPVPPVNIIIDSDMAISVDDVGDHAVLWALANRGEINVLALVCSSANDFSAPAMRAIANYYGHPGIPIGAHQGSTPSLENSATSNYAQLIVNQFGTPGDTRANYPDAVTVYRQALASAPDHSVSIVANGYYQPLQGLLQSLADSISPLTGIQLVSQKVKRLVLGAGFFPSGNEHNLRVDADAASFVFANWPVELVSVGVEVSQDVFTGPSATASPATDPVKAAWNIFNGSNPVPGFGQVPLLFAARGLGANFVVPGLNGQTMVQSFSEVRPGQDNWFPTPNVGESYIEKKATAADLQAILNPLLQSSSNMPILRSISPSSVQGGASGQRITLTGTNFFSDSQIRFNGNARPTTLISATQMSFQLADSDLSQAGQQALSVANSEGGGWISNALSLTVAAIAPALTGISPASATAGSGPVTITATGANFVSASSVQVNGGNRSTVFVSSTQLTATLTAADLAVAGSLPITVNTPSPGGGASSAATFTVSNPVPSLSSISPSGAIAGSAGFTLTVNGGNFIPGSTVQVQGSNRTTTFVSGTQLTAAIPASDIASVGSVSVAVVNPAPGGGTSAALALAVNNAGPNPLPTLSGLSPDSVIAGSGAFTLILHGSNFVPASLVQVNGSNRPTTYVSSSQLTAAIPAADVASASFPSISVVNPAPGGGVWSLTFAVNNPQPTLSGLSPDNVIAGSGAFTLTLNGVNFIPGSVAQVNGANRTTSFVSATQLTAAIPASDVASASFPSISVVNPGPGGGVYSLTFAVNNPLPTLSGLAPDSVIAGSGAFTLTLNGSNFIPASVVQVNGANRTTTFVSGTQLTSAIPASDVASASFPSISVVNPGPGGGVWSLTFAVNNPQPTISGLSPSSVTAGSGAFTLTLNGANFIPGSVVQVNGSSRTTTFASTTRLTAAIPASDVTSAGNLSVSVVNPGPGGGVWAFTLSVNP
ncbi:MAG TPA: IPT/TIG domain-containing protein [Candidatus Saccharimonadales bacterium]|jgi:hypothetical protein|nr:IPT/TIG domain-containing protein [Candidatus Saccharimonadales bacterium]